MYSEIVILYHSMISKWYSIFLTVKNFNNKETTMYNAAYTDTTTGGLAIIAVILLIMIAVMAILAYEMFHIKNTDIEEPKEYSNMNDDTCYGRNDMENIKKNISEQGKWDNSLEKMVYFSEDYYLLFKDAQKEPYAIRRKILQDIFGETDGSFYGLIKNGYCDAADITDAMFDPNNDMNVEYTIAAKRLIQSLMIYLCSEAAPEDCTLENIKDMIADERLNGDPVMSKTDKRYEELRKRASKHIAVQLHDDFLMHEYGTRSTVLYIVNDIVSDFIYPSINKAFQFEECERYMIAAVDIPVTEMEKDIISNLEAEKEIEEKVINIVYKDVCLSAEDYDVKTPVKVSDINYDDIFTYVDKVGYEKFRKQVQEIIKKFVKDYMAMTENVYIDEGLSVDNEV